MNRRKFIAAATATPLLQILNPLQPLAVEENSLPITLATLMREAINKPWQPVPVFAPVRNDLGIVVMKEMSGWEWNPVPADWFAGLVGQEGNNHES